MNNGSSELFECGLIDDDPDMLQLLLLSLAAMQSVSAASRPVGRRHAVEYL